MVTNGTVNDNPGFIVDYNASSSSCSIRKISSSRQPVKKIDKNSRSRPMSKANADKLFDVQYKVLLLGDTRVGKTSLQRAIMDKDFRPEITSTIGFDFVNKTIPIETVNVQLQIWDTAGQKNFRSIGKGYYAATRAFILVYDVTSPETFYLIEQFNQLIEEAKLDMERRYLVANKIDLEQSRKIDEETGRRYAVRNSMIYFETSCKTGENVQDLFERIASDLTHQHHSDILNLHKPVKNLFPFNYDTQPVNNNPTGYGSTEPTNSSKQTKFTMFPSLPYEPIDKSDRFDIRRLLLCCRPKKPMTKHN